MKDELDLLGYGNKDGYCPHCGEFYEEKELDEMLSFDEDTDFQCRNCNKWIRGFLMFSVMGSDIEYHLAALGIIKEE